MKTKLFLMGMLAAALTFGITFTACGSGDETVAYTLRYDANGGSGAIPSSQTAASGSNVTLASGSGLTKVGYIFSGWNANTSGTGTTYEAGSSYSVTANITLYAKWTAVTYTVSYNANGGSGTAPASQQAASGSSVTLAGGSGLTKAGYTFSGWNTNASGAGTTYEANSSYSVTANITFYAQWENAGNGGVTITLESNGEYGWQKQYQEPSLLKGEQIIAGNTYTIEYSFVSNVPMDYFQMTLVDNSEASGYSWIVLSDYQKAKENVPANATMSGTATLTASTTATDATPSANMLVLQAGTGTARQPVLTFTKLILTSGNGGNEEPAMYTVSYNANGGSGTVPSSQTAASGSSVALASGSGLTKAGYTFSGWNTNASGTGTSYAANSSYSVTATVTLYAQWTTNTAPTYTVSYNANGGSGTVPSSQSANSGSSVALASGSGLTKAGHAFSGWNTNSSGTGTTYAANSSYSVTADTTLYAKWTANTAATYTVSYNANGGSGTAPASQQAASGSSVTVKDGSGLTKAGYTFSGWNTNASGTGTTYAANSSYSVTATVTLYVQWTAVTYTVSYNANSGSGTPPSSQTADSGSSVTVKSGSGLTKPDHVFNGWNTEPSGTGTSYEAGDSFDVVADVTLYAQWEKLATVTSTVYFISKDEIYSPLGTKFGIGNLQFSGSRFNIALLSDLDVGSSLVDGPYTLVPGTYEVRFVEPDGTCRPNWLRRRVRSSGGTTTISEIDEEAVSFTFEGNKVYTVYYEHTSNTGQTTDSRGNVRYTTTTNRYRLSVKEGTD